VILAGKGQAAASQRARRAYPIHFYSGRNGSGKTLAAVWDTMPTLDAGRPVLSTVRLLDWRNPRPCDDDACSDPWHGREGHLAAHPLYERFTTWPQLLGWSFGDVLMDEITGVADSNEGASMPPAVANKLPQLRRDDCPVRITALNWIRANKRIREAVNAVTRCSSSLPVRKSETDFAHGRVFRPRRLTKQVTYDAETLPIDDQTQHAYDGATVICKGRLWIPQSDAIRAYDTFAPVSVVGTVTDSGRCAFCGGTRRGVECSCSDYQGAKAARTDGRAQARLRDEHGRPPGRSAPVARHGHEVHS
jgi:hypothetical protein